MGQLRVWGEIEEIVARELGALLDTTFRPVPATPDRLTFTSVVPLTLVSNHVHLELGIGVDERTRDHLARALLGGDTTHEAMDDAMREMANTAGGAISRAAHSDGMSVALGLPSNENVFASGTGKRRVWTMMGENGMLLECVVTAHAREARTIAARELKEGMVLASNVTDESGNVVAPSGTSLTRSMASVIAFLLGDEHVEISA